MYLNVETEEAAALRETMNHEEGLEIDNDSSHAEDAGIYIVKFTIFIL